MLDRYHAAPRRAPPRSPTPTAEARIAEVTVHHADKLWWPDDAITKGDVARFYDAIAPHVLPWTADRPLVAERCPDGMNGSCFFQKNFPGTAPADVPRISLVAESTDRPVHYLVGRPVRSCCSSTWAASPST